MSISVAVLRYVDWCCRIKLVINNSINYFLWDHHEKPIFKLSKLWLKRNINPTIIFKNMFKIYLL